MKEFFAELKRRNVYKVAVAYAVVGWLLIQIATATFPVLELPNWAAKLVIALVVLGFPIALILAWAFELTPQGFKRTEDVAPNDPITARTGRKATIGITVVAAIVGALFLYGLLRPSRTEAAKSLAVLPFVNQSGDPAQEYFSDGLTEELINGLGQLRELRVIGRNSSFHFKGRSEDSRAVGQTLGVANLLEGSVRKAGERVRIAVQLVDAATGTQRWSQTYDRELRDIFAVQTEIARSVADELRVTLLQRELQPSAQPSNRNLDAYTAYLQGEHHNRRGNVESLTRALEFFDEAIRLDPKYAEAYALKSLAWAQLAYFRGAKGADAWEQARAAANAAIAIKPDLPRARSALAYVYLNDWNLAAAEAELQKIPPGDARTVPNMLALVRLCRGQIDEAIALQQKAIKADPVFPLFRRNLGTLYTGAGRLDDAEREIRKALELQPNAAEFYLGLVEVALLQGKPDVALREAELEPPGVLRDVAIALASAAQPDRAQADAALQTLIERHGESAPFRIAVVYATRNEPDKTFEWLERAYAARDPRLIRLLTTPFLLRYKSDPRFAELCRRVSLPPPR